MIDNYQHRHLSVMYNVHYAYNLAVFDDSDVFLLGESFSLTSPHPCGEDLTLSQTIYGHDHVVR